MIAMPYKARLKEGTERKRPYQSKLQELRLEKYENGRKMFCLSCGQAY